MPIITRSGKVLTVSGGNEHVILQSDLDTFNKSELLTHRKTSDRNKIEIHNFGEFEVIETKQNGLSFLKKGKFFLCAHGDSASVTCDRLHPDDWEKFIIVADDAFDEDVPKALVDVALYDYSFGHARLSLSKLEDIQKYFPDSEYALLYRVKLTKLLDAARFSHNGKARLIINCNLRDMFEYEWMNHILGPLDSFESADPGSVSGENLIIIDQHIRGPHKVNFYKKLYENYNNIALIHLSDETFEDDHNCYRWCSNVWRNLWSPVLASEKKVSFFPLGYKSGYFRDQEPKNSLDRKYTWFFAGDIKKSSRKAMYDNMSEVKGGYTHLTTYFNSSDALSTDAYRLYMDDSIFIPCPAGFIHLDSFRIYEALEAGCIPIVENSRDFDFFTPYLGDNPVPMITDWSEAPVLIDRLYQSGNVENCRKQCYQWWTEYKATIRENLARDIKNLGRSFFL